MIVRVRGYLTFRDVIGDHRLEMPGDRSCTLRMLIEMLAQDIGESNAAQLLDVHTGKPRQNIAILVNGHSFKNLPNKLDSKLEDGDEVAIFPPIMGGGHSS